VGPIASRMRVAIGVCQYQIQCAGGRGCLEVPAHSNITKKGCAIRFIYLAQGFGKSLVSAESSDNFSAVPPPALRLTPIEYVVGPNAGADGQLEPAVLQDPINRGSVYLAHHGAHSGISRSATGLLHRSDRLRKTSIRRSGSACAHCRHHVSRELTKS
jgi:hypothetical protein